MSIDELQEGNFFELIDFENLNFIEIFSSKPQKGLV
jgi:hypothetical protein